MVDQQHMRRVEWVDEMGRKWAVWIPAGMPDSEGPRGIPIGPVDLGPLGLPIDIEVRLHNELFARDLLTEQDLRRRTVDVASAVQSVLRVAAREIISLYERDTA